MKSIYDYEHEPIEHFARRGYDALEAGVGLPEEWEGDVSRQKRAIDEGVLALLRDGWPTTKRQRRKQTDDSPRESLVEFCGRRIDWHLGLPELKVWAGQASLETIIDSRIQAIRENDLPDGTSLLEWGLPLMTASGLDRLTAASAIDIGFSPSAIGMPVVSLVAAELLAIIGLQVTPIIRYGYRSYGYYGSGKWWRFGQEDRDGGYQRRFGRSRCVDGVTFA